MNEWFRLESWIHILSTRLNFFGSKHVPYFAPYVKPKVTYTYQKYLIIYVMASLKGPGGAQSHDGTQPRSRTSPPFSFTSPAPGLNHKLFPVQALISALVSSTPDGTPPSFPPSSTEPANPCSQRGSRSITLSFKTFLGVTSCHMPFRSILPLLSPFPSPLPRESMCPFSQGTTGYLKRHSKKSDLCSLNPPLFPPNQNLCRVPNPICHP